MHHSASRVSCTSAGSTTAGGTGSRRRPSTCICGCLWAGLSIASAPMSTLSMTERTHYHVGWPPRDVHQILDRVKRGLPTYWPTDPKPCDQTEYLRFATERGPNSQ